MSIETDVADFVDGLKTRVETFVADHSKLVEAVKGLVDVIDMIPGLEQAAVDLQNYVTRVANEGVTAATPEEHAAAASSTPDNPPTAPVETGNVVSPREDDTKTSQNNPAAPPFITT